MTKSEMDLVAVLARIGRDDRELYRQLRAEAWALVQRNHVNKSEEQKARWLRNAS